MVGICAQYFQFYKVCSLEPWVFSFSGLSAMYKMYRQGKHITFKITWFLVGTCFCRPPSTDSLVLCKMVLLLDIICTYFCHTYILELIYLIQFPWQILPGVCHCLVSWPSFKVKLLPRRSSLVHVSDILVIFYHRIFYIVFQVSSVFLISQLSCLVATHLELSPNISIHLGGGWIFLVSGSSSTIQNIYPISCRLVGKVGIFFLIMTMSETRLPFLVVSPPTVICFKYHKCTLILEKLMKLFLWQENYSLKITLWFKYSVYLLHI